MDEPRRAVAIDLPAKAGDVDLDRVGVRLCVSLPQRTGEPPLREDLPLVARQGLEELVLLGGEPHLRSIPLDLVGPGVEREGADPQHRGPRLRPDPQQRPDPGRELPERDGLGDVVVGTDIETRHHVVGRVQRGEHEDGDLASLRAQVSADLQPRPLREHEVQEDQLVLLALCGPEPVLAVLGDIDRVPFVLKTLAQRARQRALVFDEQDPGHEDRSNGTDRG